MDPRKDKASLRWDAFRKAFHGACLVVGYTVTCGTILVCTVALGVEAANGMTEAARAAATGLGFITFVLVVCYGLVRETQKSEEWHDGH